MPEFEKPTEKTSGNTERDTENPSSRSGVTDNPSPPPVAPHNSKATHYEPGHARHARRKDSPSDPNRNRIPMAKTPPRKTHYPAQPSFFTRLLDTISSFFKRATKKQGQAPRTREPRKSEDDPNRKRRRRGGRGNRSRNPNAQGGQSSRQSGPRGGGGSSKSNSQGRGEGNENAGRRRRRRNRGPRNNRSGGGGGGGQGGGSQQS